MSQLAVRRAVVGVGAAAGLVGSFLPWLDTGERSRSSYDLSNSVRRLGLARTAVERWIVLGWPLVPLLLVGATVWFMARADVTSRALLVIAAAYVGAVAAVVWASPFERLAGIPVTLCGAVAIVMGALPPGLRRTGGDRRDR